MRKLIMHKNKWQYSYVATYVYKILPAVYPSVEIDHKQKTIKN